MNNILLVFSLLLTNQVVFAKTSTQPVKVLINNTNWMPYFFTDKGAPKGLGGEILDICLPEAKAEPEYVNQSIKRMYKNMESGSLDLNIFSYKRERQKFLYYGREPLFKSQYKPFVRKDSKIKIKKISDFDGHKLGHLAGLRYSPKFLEYIEKRKKAGTLDEVDLDKLNLLKLVAKKIDIFVSTAATVHWLAKQEKLTDKIKELPFSIKNSYYFVTVSKKSKNIKDKRKFLKDIDLCIKRMKSDGTYQKIVNKYRI